MTKPLPLLALLFALQAAAQQSMDPIVSELAGLTGSARKQGCSPQERELSTLLAGMSHETEDPSEENLRRIGLAIAAATALPCGEIADRVARIHKATPGLRARVASGLARVVSQPSKPAQDEQ